jgi:hypothetical protein
MERRDRYLQLQFARDLRRDIWSQSRRCNVPFKLLVDVERHSTPVYYATLVMLLETKTFKSTFRERIALWAREWFEEDAIRSVRSMPISEKQANACAAPGLDSRLKKMPRYRAQQAHIRRNEFRPFDT